jgi:hypothetical protein
MAADADAPAVSAWHNSIKQLLEQVRYVHSDVRSLESKSPTAKQATKRLQAIEVSLETLEQQTGAAALVG